jgi:NAD(P)-dependent dehydrogenase (short-subunit alcohol dehydrogenase family)
VSPVSPRAFVLTRGAAAVTEAVVRGLEHDGWTVELARQPTPSGCALQGVVYVPGLLAGPDDLTVDPARELVDLIDTVLPRLSRAESGGARVVAVGSRDWLGWPSRPHLAACAAGLLATVRSLALAHGRAGVTVNAVVGIPSDADLRREAGAVPGTHLYEPVPLTGEPVTPDDLAATVSFFLDPRSGYITGQVLHCCGGASLLSSLSV